MASLWFITGVFIFMIRSRFKFGKSTAGVDDDGFWCCDGIWVCVA